jgi:hypothetical protein
MQPGTPHSDRVVRRRTHPQVEILRRARQLMRGKRVSANDKKLSLGVAQRGQHLDEVAIHENPAP